MAAQSRKQPARPRAARPVAIANRHPRLRIDRAAIVEAIAILDENAVHFRQGCPPGELSLVFLTDAALARLHGDFLNDPSITDVITFAAPTDNQTTGVAEDVQSAGEICVSADAAVRQKRRRSAARDDTGFSEELTLYAIHGWLHLAGYDDLEPKHKRIMRRAEARALQLLRGARALPRFAFRR